LCSGDRRNAFRVPAADAVTCSAWLGPVLGRQSSQSVGDLTSWTAPGDRIWFDEFRGFGRLERINPTAYRGKQRPSYPLPGMASVSGGVLRAAEKRRPPVPTRTKRSSPAPEQGWVCLQMCTGRYQEPNHPGRGLWPTSGSVARDRCRTGVPEPARGLPGKTGPPQT